jgi:hypothetical protein
MECKFMVISGEKIETPRKMRLVGLEEITALMEL